MFFVIISRQVYVEMVRFCLLSKSLFWAKGNGFDIIAKNVVDHAIYKTPRHIKRVRFAIILHDDDFRVFLVLVIDSCGSCILQTKTNVPYNIYFTNNFNGIIVLLILTVLLMTIIAC